jgi:hypothetical protein
VAPQKRAAPQSSQPHCSQSRWQYARVGEAENSFEESLLSASLSQI